MTAAEHAKTYSPVFELTEAHPIVALKPIELAPSGKSTECRYCDCQKTPYRTKNRSYGCECGSFYYKCRNNALEVLEKSPGIAVDKDGNISLKGKDGVCYLVDGRQTYLSGADLANYLRNMNANQMDQIEIMTNPPAKYDASGNSGIINIKTKKNKQMGYNGSINFGYGQGFYPKYNDGFNFNYRKNKVNLFTNLSHNYSENFNTLTIQRNFRDKTYQGSACRILNRRREMKTFPRSYNAKLGMDYFRCKEYDTWSSV